MIDRLIFLDDVALRLMDRLTVQADAKVVLSSAWRVGRTIRECQDIFFSRDAFNIAERMIAKTPHGMGVRGEEIAKYLREHGECAYVIIDDDSDMLPEQMPRFVQTSFLTGFRAPEYVAALRLLNPEHRDCRILDGYRVKHLSWEEAAP